MEHKEKPKPNWKFERLPDIGIGGDYVKVYRALDDRSIWYAAEDLRRICEKPCGKFDAPCRQYAYGTWPIVRTRQLVTFDAMMRFVIKHSPRPMHEWTAAFGYW